MIISASRRTDIPCFFGEWFMGRVKAGSVLVRNPTNIHQISRVPLGREGVDCIVFWTKNPSDKFISNLHTLDELGYKYYFLFTITSYAQDIEKAVPKKALVIEKFKTLSKMLGSDKVIWRYDPVFVSDKYTVDYHKKYFETLAAALEGATNKCIISFIDIYKRIKTRLEKSKIAAPTGEEVRELAAAFSQSAKKHALQLESCCEEVDLEAFGVEHASCIDGKLISKICGKAFEIKKDDTQRAVCGCVKSVDIGSYNTCRNGCLYCYATWGKGLPLLRDEDKEILGESVGERDTVSSKVIKPCKVIENEFLDLPF